MERCGGDDGRLCRRWRDARRGPDHTRQGRARRRAGVASQADVLVGDRPGAVEAHRCGIRRSRTRRCGARRQVRMLLFTQDGGDTRQPGGGETPPLRESARSTQAGYFSSLDFCIPPRLTYIAFINPAWFAQRPPRVPARGVYFCWVAPTPLLSAGRRRDAAAPRKAPALPSRLSGALNRVRPDEKVSRNFPCFTDLVNHLDRQRTPARKDL
jgi:hypothetical protein